MLLTYWLALTLGTTTPSWNESWGQEPIVPVAYAEVYKLDVNSTSSVASYVERRATEEGVSSELALSLVACESGFVPQQSKVIRKDGTRENSWGIWQINLDWNPDITREESMDIPYSTNWALSRLKEGKASLWSCYKK